MSKYRSYKYNGLIIALSVEFLWGISLGTLLYLGTQTIPAALYPLAILWQMFLYTGLFITAHDAMHGLIVPGRNRANRITGGIAVWLYALFSFRKLQMEHWKHHRNPGDPDQDPDFHDGRRSGFLSWYLRFLRHYVTVWQLVGMAIVFNILHHVLNIDVPTLLLFWVLPSLLSTLQLFLFGTYLPHRKPGQGRGLVHHTSSNEYPVWLSFITCYHFGYHLEHHERPDIPWWKLPEYRRETLQGPEILHNQG